MQPTEDRLRALLGTLEDQVRAVGSDGDRCRQTMAILREIGAFRERLLRQESARILQFFKVLAPDAHGLELDMLGVYDDEGSYNTVLDEAYLLDAEGQRLSPAGGLGHYVTSATAMILPTLDPPEVYGSERETKRIELPQMSAEARDGFAHPMMQVFGAYAPSDLPEWSRISRLLTSLDASERQQGARRIADRIEGDASLCEALVSLSEPSLEEAYLPRLWWVVLAQDEGDWEVVRDVGWLMAYTTSDDAEKVVGYYGGSYLSGWSEQVTKDKDPYQRPLHRLLLPLVHRALLAQDMSTEAFLAEAEQLLGEPLTSS